MKKLERFGFRSLRTKLFLIFLVLAIVPVSIFATMAYQQIEQDVKESVSRELIHTGHKIMENYELDILTFQREMISFQDQLDEHDLTVEEEFTHLQSRLERLEAFCGNSAFYSEDRTLVIGTDMPGAPTKLESPLIALRENASGDFNIALGMPVKRNQQFIGTLFVQTCLDKLEKDILSQTRDSPIDITLISKDADIIMSTKDFPPEFLGNITNYSAVKNAIQGYEGYSLERYNQHIDLITYLAPLGPLKQTGMSMLIHIPYDEALAGARDIRNRFIGFGAIIFILVIMLSLLVSSMFSQPIRQLYEATEMMKKGKYDIELDTRTIDDEIGRLMESFNELAEKLKKSKR